MEKRASREALRSGAIRLSFILSIFLIPISVALFSSCGTEYKGMDTAEGRRAILDDANNFLTSGNCQQAIDVLAPLYNSIHVDNEIRMVFASAYACLGGFTFTGVLGALQNLSGSDMWTPLVKANYSGSALDGKSDSLVQAAEILRTTRNTADTYEARYRPSDANVLMIFIQAQIISTTIAHSGFGAAIQSTGKKTVAITGKGSSIEKCRIEVAIATIRDSLSSVSLGSSFSAITNAFNACGGACPTNLKPTVCTAAEQAEGAALITIIDAQWI